MVTFGIQQHFRSDNCIRRTIPMLQTDLAWIHLSQQRHIVAQNLLVGRILLFHPALVLAVNSKNQ